VRDVSDGDEINENRTLIDKIFQKSSLPTQNRSTRVFSHFLQLAIFVTKTTSFILKNVIFIILIFSELNALHA